ncbi:MAG TPA: ABC transporter permease [Bacteroidales bacterium]|nr:ABC transporter permease [Bacteroidales bacterium]
MIKNYLKAAIYSMFRRKWFSLLTLFSISISLVMVTCGASMWNMITAPIAPEVNKGRTFFLNARLDSKSGDRQFSDISLIMEITSGFLIQDVYRFKTPELTTIYEKHGGYTEFIRNNKTKKAQMIRTDANFFKVFEFDFITGKPYLQTNSTEKANTLCVISKELADYFFGGPDCLGQVINDLTHQFKVVGVVTKPTSQTSLKSDIYYLAKPDEINRGGLYQHNVAFLCHSKQDKQTLDAELNKYTFNSDKGQVTMSSDSPAIQYLTEKIDFEEGSLRAYIALGLIALIIPALCLVDILKNNLSHRNEELAIRRAFGAPRKSITSLLLIDNLLLTLTGGILGLGFSFLFYAVLSDDTWTNLFFVFFNWRAFFYYIAVFLIIGGIAGVLPSYRISKQQIVNALYAIEND